MRKVGGYIGSLIDYFLGLGVRPDEQDVSKRAYIQYFNFDLMGYMAFAVLSYPIVFLLPEQMFTASEVRTSSGLNGKFSCGVIVTAVAHEFPLLLNATSKSKDSPILGL